MPDEALNEYRRKRRAGATPEPMGEPDPASRSALTFVVHEHHARRLHWDFRLERDGVLVSWAIPKGLPPDPATNHLAVHVEDHPFEYGSFAGTIPAGQYGAGTVKIWDNGTYETEKWTDREVKVVLHGKRVQGRFVLFRTKDPNWMIHRMDGPERPDWQAIPADLQPMIATNGRLAPRTGDDWAYEMRWSGLRVLIAVEGGRLKVRTKDGRDLTASFPEFRPIGLALGTTQVLIDGIVVCLQDGSRPDAELLSQRVAASSPATARTLAKKVPATLFAIDLLHLDGDTFLTRPYRERRTALEGLPWAAEVAQVPPSFGGDGHDALAAAKEHGLSGIVAKRIQSPYRPGRRSTDWVEISVEEE